MLFKSKKDGSERTKPAAIPAASKPQNPGVLVYGYHAVFALFKKRPSDIIRAYCTEERLAEMGPILKECAKLKKAYHIVTKEDLARIAASVHHEGLALLAKERPILDEAALLRSLSAKAEPLIIFDGVQNPHNVGAIMRAMAHFGWSKILVNKKQDLKLTSSAARMSEGGSEFVDLFTYTDLRSVASKLKAQGYQLLGTSSHATQSIYQKPMPGAKWALVFGHEVYGMSDETKGVLDGTLALPHAGQVQSLNVAMACALIVGEWVRQNGIKG